MVEDSAGTYRSFPTTHWSQVDRAGGDDPQTKREILDQLVRIYLPALRVHLIRKKRLAADRAEDYLQDFLARKIVERDIIASADRSLGRFRT
jgi:hypothetical protein